LKSKQGGFVFDGIILRRRRESLLTNFVKRIFLAGVADSAGQGGVANLGHLNRELNSMAVEPSVFRGSDLNFPVIADIEGLNYIHGNQPKSMTPDFTKG
jgi:hypothetical protein